MNNDALMVAGTIGFVAVACTWPLLKLMVSWEWLSQTIAPRGAAREAREGHAGRPAPQSQSVPHQVETLRQAAIRADVGWAAKRAYEANEAWLYKDSPA